jgi:hypothetical protein
MNEKIIVSGDEASVYIGSLLENMEGGSFTGDCERKV